MAIISGASFSADPIMILAPGMRADIARESNGMDIGLEYDLSEVWISARGHRVPVGRKQLIDALAGGNDDVIRDMVIERVRYLRAVLSQLGVRRRKFRTKQRSILSRER